MCGNASRCVSFSLFDVSHWFFHLSEWWKEWCDWVAGVLKMIPYDSGSILSHSWESLLQLRSVFQISDCSGQYRVSWYIYLIKSRSFLNVNTSIRKFKKDLHTVDNHLLMMSDYLPINSVSVVHLASLLGSISYQMWINDWFMILHKQCTTRIVLH